MHPFLRHSIIFIVIFSTIVLQSLSAQGLYINEYMASNSKTIADPDYSEYGDWFELYNAGSTPVNLKGYSVTDLLSLPRKYVITSDIIVNPQSFIIIWADDKATGVHANFKLSASGESIGLFNASGFAVDTLTFGAQTNDVSTGRFPNGAPVWYKMSPASPGAANLEMSIADKLPPPAMSSAAGFYSGPITVNLTHPTVGAVIRYTLDGRTPTEKSPLYSSAITVDSTRVIRAKAFKDGMLPSMVATSTYFINETTDLPVFSLSTDPENLFSDTSGIYVAGTNGVIDNCSTVPRNWNQDWERPVDLEFFEKNKQAAFKVSTGVKIYGGCSRLYPEKSLAFYFRGNYGFDKLRYPLFPDQLITEYNNFTLRSSGQDWWRTMFRDAMAQTLIEKEMNVDYQDYRPSILFINGQYWGIHNVGEKLNEHYIESHYNINGDSIDLIEISKAVEANMGDLVAYNSMMDFVSANNLSVQSNYQYITSIIDVNEYIDYQIAQIFSANGDWPGSNIKLWRERKPGARWKWMIYDLDFTFGGNSQGQYNTNTLAQATATNGPSWPNPPWATLMLRKLLENTEFKNEFIQRYAVRLNTTYEKNRVIAIIDSLAQGIASEIPRHKIRWPQSLSLDKNDWKGNIQIMKDFATLRPDTTIKHFMTKFGIVGTNTLIIGRNNSEWGKVFTHSVELKKNGSSNLFFRNIPLKIKAQAMPGYRFVKWQGIISSSVPETSIIVTTNSTLTAIFEPAQLTVNSPVINEINYKSAALFDTDDWIELYNPSADSIDLAGWSFSKDSANTYTFSAGVSLRGREYLVLCRDTVKFRTLRSKVKTVIGNTNFGLSSSGEHLQLFDSGKKIVDDVLYSSLAPWCTEPNGTGSTLSLTNPQKDNSIPDQWRSSKLYGTPGELNDVYTGVRNISDAPPENYLLFNNYPNPFNPSTVIGYQIPQNSRVSVSIYDVLGKNIALLVNEQQSAGTYEVQWNGEGHPSGIYFYVLSAGNYFETKRMLLLK